MNTNRLATLGTVILTLAFAPAALAQDFEISWHTIDGGGEMFSNGGNFELSGTIGQPDAGVMTGGDFALTGGFWQPFDTVVHPCAALVCGDTSCDGTFNGADIDPFFEALGDPAGWQINHPGCELLCVADINHDGAVNGADIDAFFTALGQGACP